MGAILRVALIEHTNKLSCTDPIDHSILCMRACIFLSQSCVCDLNSCVLLCADADGVGLSRDDCERVVHGILSELTAVLSDQNLQILLFGQ